MQIPLLKDIVVIFGVSILVLLVCYRIRVPTIVGFLLTGVLIGPHGLGFVKSVHDVEMLAEIGIVLLLFTIGIEFSLQKLLQVKKPVLLGGSLQVTATLLAVFGLVSLVTPAPAEALFIGFLLALSSTAIVMKIFQERAEVDSLHGRMALAILIFQDLAIVPMIIFTPLLVGQAGGGLSSLLLILKALGVVVLILFSATFLVPGLLHLIVRTRSRELFLLSVVLICIAVAWLTSLVGLSLGLGAFLAGLVISESEYSHQALEGILPFKDVFNSFFFISVGMLLEVGFLFEKPLLIALLTAAVLILKTVIAGMVALSLGASLRTSLLAGLSLSQVGEFSFILSKTGLAFGLIEQNVYQLFLSISVLSMALTPFIIAVAPRVADAANRLPFPARLKTGAYLLTPGLDDLEKRVLRDHVIIVGYGLNGRNLARAARTVGILYTIVEANPDTVHKERARGEPIHYGDATHEAVLRQAHIESARIMVIAISDPSATARVTQLARRMNPELHIIVRTRFVAEIKSLYEAGANAVIPEEFETSIEIFTLVLMKYLVPREEIELIVNQVRSENYRMFRSLSQTGASLEDLRTQLADIGIYSLRLAEHAPAIGKTLGELDLRKNYGVTVLAIRREGKILPNPGPHTQICLHDRLFVLGSPEEVKQVEVLFRPKAG